MPRLAPSVFRLMIGIAALAVGLATLLPFQERPFTNDPALAVLIAAVALVLAVGVDRAFFGKVHRPFWLGFTAAVWLCAATTLGHLPAVRRVILKNGPPIVRLREDYVRQRIAAQRASVVGDEMEPPRVSEWRLLMSGLAESGLGVALGLLVAGVGGLLTASVMTVARWIGRPATASQSASS